MIKFKKTDSYEKITFTADGFQLEGILHLPQNRNPPVVIGSHGLLSDKTSPKQIELARQCNVNGIGFFRFDHRGCGNSQGIFEDVTSLTSRKNDLISAVKTIESLGTDKNQIGIFGSSMGGATCLIAAQSLGINPLVIYGAPIRISKMIDISGLIEETGQKSGSRETMPLDFDISNHLKGIRNILIIHGDADEMVPFAHAHEIYEKVDEPKQLIPLKNGDHLLSNKTNQDVFMKETVGWFKNYLDI